MKQHGHRTRLVLALGLTCTVLVAGMAQADEKAGGGDLRAAAQNPISSLIALPFKFIFDDGAPNGDANFLNLQPVYPISVGDWNLVNRVILPIVDLDGSVSGTPEIPNPSGGNGASGLGDTNYSLFISPAKSGGVIWGIGPSIMLDTASDDQLGSGKWSAGPTAVALTQPKWGSFGVLGRQIWSFAGDDDRADVNQFLLEPFLNYNLDNGWFLVTDMVMTANWDAKSSQRWTIPLGGGVGRMFKIGNQAINSRLEYYYNVERPDGAAKSLLSFTWSFLFPKK